jgi:hypothetical protein
VIAGTGRAGTTFLVQFFGACGLDVGRESLEYEHKRARAGLEHRLLADAAPYVVKDPWLFVYCNAVDLDAISIDALIVPVRELMTAATSRVVQELMARPDDLWQDWGEADVHGMTAGGVIYSLEPVDQARILAVGLYRLMHWAALNQIRVFPVEFPRSVTDREYLLDVLWPWLGDHCDRAAAAAAFDVVAHPELVRTERWVAASSRPGKADSATPSLEQLDRTALTELLIERGARLAAVEAECADLRERLADADLRLRATADQLQAARAELQAVQAMQAAGPRSGGPVRRALGLARRVTS